MELSEMIKIMQHYENGGKVEFLEKKGGGNHWATVISPSWDWACFDYRIKEQKQKVTIEKWLLKNASNGEYFIYDSSRVDLYLKETISIEKVKLIKSYEIEL